MARIKRHPNWMTTNEVAEMLNRDRNTVLKLLKTGELPGRKLGDRYDFPRNEIEKLAGYTLESPAGNVGWQDHGNNDTDQVA